MYSCDVFSSFIILLYFILINCKLNLICVIDWVNALYFKLTLTFQLTSMDFSVDSIDFLIDSIKCNKRKPKTENENSFHVLKVRN